MKRLIATDFDGTFIRHGRIDPGYHTAIRAFRQAGGLFGFVTGRGTDFFRTAEEYGVTADFFCLYNGSLLALPDGTPVKEYRIPRADFAALDPAAVVGSRQTPYGVSAIVRREALPEGFAVEPVSLEDLFVVMVKGEERA